MKERKSRVFACDFETTVYKGQEFTEVWAGSCCELYTDRVEIFHSIDEQFKYFESLDCNIIGYYHNLKFDGSFWLHYLLVEKQFKHACIESETDFKWLPVKLMPNNSITYSISDMGQWYRIIIKVHDNIIELRDSLKLLPFSLERIGKSFATAHKKLDMEYTGFRYAGCEITPEEQAYIRNDVLVLKEALEIMQDEGHRKLTIGSCCLSEFQKTTGWKQYQKLFPDLYKIQIDKNLYGSETAGEYIRNSYKGGWCYLVKGKENKVYKNGMTADVNSLYPSVMSSESLSIYPTGAPTFWKGEIPPEAQESDKYYFIRVHTRFQIKQGKLPFIQVKNSLLYKGTEMLETSDITDLKTGKKYSEYIDFDGNRQQAYLTLTLTCTDWKLFQEHYNLIDCTILDGCYFDAKLGIFDEYINKYKKIKLESKDAKRELAKLFLNNLYGKMASSPDSSFKVAYIKPDGVLGFYTVFAKDKKPGYIAVGSAITSYARNFTIRAAQANYYGVDKPGFIYADTDSIHCDLSPEKIKGVIEHEKNFCCWKFESFWDKAIFVRQKTYIEHLTHENREKLQNPNYEIKCAGMPERCKALLRYSLENEYPGSDEIEKKHYTMEELDFIHKRGLKDFKRGLCIPGKLLPKRIKGGILLCETTYEMR